VLSSFLLYFTIRIVCFFNYLTVFVLLVSNLSFMSYFTYALFPSCVKRYYTLLIIVPLFTYSHCRDFGGPVFFPSPLPPVLPPPLTLSSFFWEA